MKIIFAVIDILLLPAVYITGAFFYMVRAAEKKLVFCNKVLLRRGILPTRTFFDKLG